MSDDATPDHLERDLENIRDPLTWAGPPGCPVYGRDAGAPLPRLDPMPVPMSAAPAHAVAMNVASAPPVSAQSMLPLPPFQGPALGAQRELFPASPPRPVAYPPALGPARTPEEEWQLRHAALAPYGPPPPMPPAATEPTATPPRPPEEREPPPLPTIAEESGGLLAPLPVRPEVQGPPPPPLPQSAEEYLAANPIPDGPPKDPLESVHSLSWTAMLLAVFLPPVGLALAWHCLRELRAQERKTQLPPGEVATARWIARLSLAAGAFATGGLLYLLVLLF